jgi:hypothetical protein
MEGSDDVGIANDCDLFASFHFTNSSESLLFDFFTLQVSETMTLRHMPSLTTDGPDDFRMINGYDIFRNDQRL